MMKKEYERPTMQVVQLKQRSQILAGSTVTQSGSIDDYKNGEFSW